MPENMAIPFRLLTAFTLVLLMSVCSAAGAEKAREYKPSVESLTPEEFEVQNTPEPHRPKSEAAPKQKKTKKAQQAQGGSSAIAGEIWRDPVTGMDFVWVPGGCYQMGQTESEKNIVIRELMRWPNFDEHSAEKFYKNNLANELPRHEVCVDGFWMGKTEVTRAQFRTFVKAARYRTDADKKGFSMFHTPTGGYEKLKGGNWERSGFDQDENHPVVNVSWNDASKMAGWLSKQGSGQYRLPTEAEWEYAARAGTRTIRYWGDDSSEACRYENVADQTAEEVITCWPRGVVHGCKDGYTFTAPVGSFQPNSLGLHDMLGNVWEWCFDTYSADAYRKHSRKNPKHTSGGPDRLRRGGSWAGGPVDTRSAVRVHFIDKLGNYLGFRLVRVSQPQSEN